MKFNGLTDKEVEASRQQYGSNVIPDSEPTTFWQEFKETFSDPMIRILLAIAALMIVMFFFGYAEIYEPLGTIAAVLIVAVVSAKTGVASDTKYRQLKDSTEKDKCKVHRNGLVTVIDVDDVVVGDKVLLQSGDKVPADGVLISGNLRVDNSALNGEAEECKKTAAAENFQLADDITGDTFVDKHSLFRGAVVFDGEGILDVRKVGLKTMMGKMAEEMQEDEPDSPLKVKLSKLAKQISTFGYIGAIVIAVLYFAYFIVSAGGVSAYFSIGFQEVIKDIVEAVSLAVVIIVCAVPEGLPLMISLVLMQNTSKMLDHNVLVRKAEGIETAGSLNILFSDKTGTITKGRLEVVDFFTADGNSIPLADLGKHSKVKAMVDLAIGRKGVNARLAVKLAGCKIDIKEESVAKSENVSYLTIDEMKKEEDEMILAARRQALIEQITREEEARKKRAEEEALNVKETVEEIPLDDEYEEDEYDEYEDEDEEEYEDEEEIEEIPVPQEKKVVKEVIEPVEYKPVIMQNKVSLDDLEKQIEEEKKKKNSQVNSNKKKYKVEEEKKEKMVVESPRMDIYTQEELDELDAEEEDEIFDDDDIDYDDYDEYYEDN